MINKLIEKIKAKNNNDDETEFDELFPDKEPKKRQLKKKINTLELEIVRLENYIKDEYYQKLMQQLDDRGTIRTVKKDNKKLRNQVKELKSKIIELENKKTEKK